MVDTVKKLREIIKDLPDDTVVLYMKGNSPCLLDCGPHVDMVYDTNGHGHMLDFDDEEDKDIPEEERGKEIQALIFSSGM